MSETPKRLRRDRFARPVMPSHPDKGRAADRRRAERAGRFAEVYARAWLRMKGWRCLAAREKTARGEIDLIVMRGRVVAFVEVKRRRDLEAARASVHDAQWRRISAAADLWLARWPELAHHEHRFDRVAVAGMRLAHDMDVWRSD